MPLSESNFERPDPMERLPDIKAVCPSVDAAEIGRRAQNYRLHMPQVTISAPALAKHWAKCETAPVSKTPNSTYEQEKKTHGYAI